MTAKPPPHPPIQAKHPGRGRIAPHKRNTFQDNEHAHVMKRKAEPLHIAVHRLMPHHPHDPSGPKKAPGNT
jgi:hypothetical protein